MIDKSKPMDLGDIFNITFKLIKETFTRNILIAVMFLVPAGIVFAIGLDSFLNSVLDAAQSSVDAGANNANGDEFSFRFSWVGIYIASSLAFFLGYLAMLIGITYVSCTALDGKRISLAKALEKIFSKTFLYAIGQALLLSFAFIGFIFAATIIIILAGLVNSAIFIVFVGIAVFAGFLYLHFLYVRWYFAFVAVVREDAGPVRAFGISYFLVKGYWWRTFGLIILTSITAQFVVSIVTTPLAFIIMWDFIAEYFKLIAGGNLYHYDPTMILGTMKSFGIYFGLVIIVSSILQSLITPLFNVVMYYDLKIRKNEFKEGEGTSKKWPSELPTID
jgi:hypothetical protein